MPAHENKWWECAAYLLISFALCFSQLTAAEETPTTGVVVSWTLPTNRVDGSLLTNLGGVYLYSTRGTQDFGLPLDIGLATSYLYFGIVTVPVYRLGGTTYDTEGIESDMSEILFWAPVEDADGNGLPDAWEFAMFGGTNMPGGLPDKDFDGDTHSNLEEFTAGTDPRDPDSFFAAHPATVEGALFSFEAREARGSGYRGRLRRYTVQRLSGDLENANGWEDMDGYTDIAGDDRIVNVMDDANRFPEAVFYRIRTWLEP